MVWPHFQAPPHPHPIHPQILDRVTAFASTSTSLACRPLAQVHRPRLPSTTPSLASRDALALDFSFSQRNCESDTEEDIAKRKALHPRRRSSTS